MLHSQESGSSVFYQSQDEGPGSDSGGDCARTCGAPFIQRQVPEARPSSGDSASCPGESAALCAPVPPPEAVIAPFYRVRTLC